MVFRAQLSQCSIHNWHAHYESTLVRKNLLRVSLADFPFDSASFAAAFGSSFGAAFTGLPADSPLISALGGSGGGGGGTGIPLGAAGGSDTCATCLEESKCEHGSGSLAVPSTCLLNCPSSLIRQHTLSDTHMIYKAWPDLYGHRAQVAKCH